MKKLILITALIAISLPGKLFAQSYVAKQMSKSKTEQTFNANDAFFNIRDFVVLKEGRMILDLHYLKDYEGFRNMDSLLTEFMKDIAFYKDSLSANPTGHVRIDYVINPEYSFKKIRFKQYNADGKIFMNQGGDISKLKFEEDTVRIIMQKSRPGLGHGKNGPCQIPYAIQATFLLGNYYDVNRVLADKVLNNVVDTLEKASQKKQTNTRSSTDQQSIIYNPYYTGKGSLKHYDRLLANEYDVSSAIGYKSRYINVNASLGAGLIRNVVAPMADIGLQYNRIWSKSVHNIFRLSATPYYLFDKNAEGTYLVRDNWFVNLALGSIYDAAEPGWLGKEVTFGAGYLFIQKGDYFKNTTVKIFTDLQVVKGFTIVPEVIATNNFKQFFPGITLKVF